MSRTSRAPDRGGRHPRGRAIAIAVDRQVAIMRGQADADPVAPLDPERAVDRAGDPVEGELAGGGEHVGHHHQLGGVGRVEGRCGGADRGQDAAPVGVLAEDVDQIVLVGAARRIGTQRRIVVDSVLDRGVAVVDTRVGVARAVAAAEAAIGLAILVVYFRNRGTIAVEDISEMKG